MSAPQKPQTPQESLPDLKLACRNHGLSSLYQIFSDETFKSAVIAKDPTFVLNRKVFLDKALTIEHEVYIKCHMNTDSYIKKIREKVLQLKDAGNPDLKVKVMMNEISVNLLVTGNPEDLVENFKKMQQDAKEWTEGAHRLDFRMLAEDVKEGEFQCHRCKSKKIWNTQRQMRCADEPMTTFFYCTSCEFRWKMG